MNNNKKYKSLIKFWKNEFKYWILPADFEKESIRKINKIFKIYQNNEIPFLKAKIYLRQEAIEYKNSISHFSKSIRISKNKINKFITKDINYKNFKNQNYYSKKLKKISLPNHKVYIDSTIFKIYNHSLENSQKLPQNLISKNNINTYYNKKESSNYNLLIHLWKNEFKHWVLPDDFRYQSFKRIDKVFNEYKEKKINFSRSIMKLRCEVVEYKDYLSSKTKFKRINNNGINRILSNY